MMLAETFLDILDDWRPAFSQQRTHLRAARQAVGSLVALGRRTVTRILWCLGREQHDWTAEYRLFSQSPWRMQDLFAPVLKRALPWCAEDHVAVAFDDTSRGKTGRKIADVRWMKHPLSPPFWINLRFGLRFLQIIGDGFRGTSLDSVSMKHEHQLAVSHQSNTRRGLAECVPDKPDLAIRDDPGSLR